jgi:hypothetical protein
LPAGTAMTLQWKSPTCEERMLYDVIIPTADAIRPHLHIWERMPPLLSLTHVSMSLVQYMYNAGHAGDCSLADLDQDFVTNAFMEVHLNEEEFWKIQSNGSLVADLRMALPPLWNQLAKLCPTIVNSVVDHSYVSGVGFSKWRGLDMEIFVETFTPRASYAPQLAI